MPSILPYQPFCLYSNWIFLDSVFVYLVSINCRAKLMAKVVYVFSVIQLWPTQTLYYKPFNQFQVHTPNHLLYQLSLSQYFSCPKSLRAKYQATKDYPYNPEPPDIIQSSQFNLVLPCLFWRKYNKVSRSCFPVTAGAALHVWNAPSS